MAAQLKRQGAPEAVIARLMAGGGDADDPEEDPRWEPWDHEVEVDEDGRPHLLIPQDIWPVVHLFLSLGTQWDHAGMSGVKTGIRYEAVRTTAGLAGIGRVTTEMFGDLQVMEAAALKEMARLESVRRERQEREDRNKR